MCLVDEYWFGLHLQVRQAAIDVGYGNTGWDPGVGSFNFTFETTLI